MTLDNYRFSILSFNKLGNLTRIVKKKKKKLKNEDSLSG